MAVDLSSLLLILMPGQRIQTLHLSGSLADVRTICNRSMWHATVLDAPDRPICKTCLWLVARQQAERPRREQTA